MQTQTTMLAAATVRVATTFTNSIPDIFFNYIVLGAVMIVITGSGHCLPLPTGTRLAFLSHVCNKKISILLLDMEITWYWLHRTCLFLFDMFPNNFVSFPSNLSIRQNHQLLQDLSKTNKFVDFSLVFAPNLQCLHYQQHCQTCNTYKA